MYAQNSHPQYLLLSQTATTDDGSGQHIWRFVLQRLDGCEHLDVSDVEPGIHGERLRLLSIVRGLEALDQPSRVMIVTTSGYISRGFRYGLETWKRNNWCWERFGQMEPVKNADLWRRIDRAMQFHEVQCRRWGHSTFEIPAPHAKQRNHLHPMASPANRFSKLDFIAANHYNEGRHQDGSYFESRTFDSDCDIGQSLPHEPRSSFAKGGHLATAARPVSQSNYPKLQLAHTRNDESASDHHDEGLTQCADAAAFCTFERPPAMAGVG